MDYSTIVLQTSSDKQLSALIYSKTKRKLLVDSERSRTPVKLQRFTYTSDGSKVIINDMTKISSPQPTEYSFQFEEVGSNDEEKRMAVREITNEGDLITIRGKVVGVAEPTVTKSTGLKVATAFLQMKWVKLNWIYGRIIFLLWKLATVHHISCTSVTVVGKEESLYSGEQYQSRSYG